MSRKKHWILASFPASNQKIALHVSKFAFQGIYMSTSRLKIIMLVIVKSLNQTIVTGGDKLGHPIYNWLTMHPNQF